MNSVVVVPGCPEMGQGGFTRANRVCAFFMCCRILVGCYVLVPVTLKGRSALLRVCDGGLNVAWLVRAAAQKSS